jgi:hypothetical protein
LENQNLTPEEIDELHEKVCQAFGDGHWVEILAKRVCEFAAKQLNIKGA